MERFIGTAVLDEATPGSRRRRDRRPRLGSRVRRSRRPPVDVHAELVLPAVREHGDVKARFEVRVAETEISLSLLRDFIQRAGSLEPSRPRHQDHGHRQWVESPKRGAGCPASRGDRRSGSTVEVKIVDPSFHNWPALPVSLADTIVPTSHWRTRASTSRTPGTISDQWRHSRWTLATG